MQADSSWGGAFEVARKIRPAEEWRRDLAARIRESASAFFAAVCTCPPGMILEAQATAVPEGFGRMIEQILQAFLPRIERAGDGASAMAAQFGSGAYAPVEMGTNAGLAARFRREILNPAGVQGLVNAFLVSSEKDVLGWIAVGTREPSPEALARIGPALTDIAAVASATLESAIDLASACGVVARGARSQQLLRLTNREREVVRLVGNGLKDAEIADRLEMSEQTVGTHLRRIYRKLGVRSRGEIASELGPFWSESDSSE
jgi:DNA-binding CsgD family transcriptional regulator